MTKKHDDFQAASNKLFLYLYERRAKLTCEIKAVGCWGMHGLSPHHIIRRSKGWACKNEPWNMLIACPNCHPIVDHPNSSMRLNGFTHEPFTLKAQFALADKLNKERGITNKEV